MDIFNLRVGNGVDFHKFAPEEGNFSIALGGLIIPFQKKLLAHSDGDVILHSICDAIFGSLGNGNIGTHFPPSDIKWKDAKSEIFLEYAINLLTNTGGKLINIDTTVICEEPKIMPFAIQIKQNIAKITGLEMAKISIKAVTTEKMGFLGKKEGIGAITTILSYIHS
jgi:2-C-methyl-D-erythritol 4-phosphate cytidylyltransferase/2-C-methyl-D-erythritol 2,4-cyclodiphosphate synthase